MINGLIEYNFENDFISFYIIITVQQIERRSVFRILQLDPFNDCSHSDFAPTRMTYSIYINCIRRNEIFIEIRSFRCKCTENGIFLVKTHHNDSWKIVVRFLVVKNRSVLFFFLFSYAFYLP